MEVLALENELLPFPVQVVPGPMVIEERLEIGVVVSHDLRPPDDLPASDVSVVLGLLAATAIADAKAQGGGTDAAAPLHQLGRSWAAATGAYRTGPGPTHVRIANGLASLAADRRRRELSAPPFSPAPPWLSTRVLAGVAATLGVGLSARAAIRG